MQKTNYIEAQDILDATNGGLEIIFFLYPQAMGSETNHNRKFKMRGDEKTASANLKQAQDGNWLVTDFGGDSQPRNGIGCYMIEKNVEFKVALNELAAQYGVAGADQETVVIRVEFSERPAETDDKELTWSWEVREAWTDNEIETIISKNVLKSMGWKGQDEVKAAAAPKRIAEAFTDYNWHPLISYSLVKNRRVMTFTATDQYPIYLIDEGSHQKLYQPLHPDKAKRFLYIGTKPKDFVHGLKQLKKLYDERREKELSLVEESKESSDRLMAIPGESPATDDADKSIDKKARIKHVILCSGGSDAINVALLGNYVIWLNSETAKLPQYLYDQISACVEKFYQLPDIDNTGKVAAHELAMQYLDIYTIELPEDLKRYRDRRGNPCKDVRDYFSHYKSKDFRQQLAVALPYRFWEKKASYEGRGENRVFTGWRYEFKNTQANNFLMKNGFGRLKVGDSDTEWIYVKRTGNLVKEVDSDLIQDFIHDFLEARNLDIDLRDAMINTSKLNSSTLARIKRVDINFDDFTPISQFYYFENKTVEVTKDGILHHKPGLVDRYIWERELIKHKIMPEAKPFTITKDELGNYDIEIHDHECLSLKFLIQVSRLHWRTEMETGDKWKAMSPTEQDTYKIKHHVDIAGPNLNQAEIDEQKLHLINKIFTIGYNLHRYHDRAKPWATYIMDGKISEDGRSHGGSGKSILGDLMLGSMLKTRFFLNGRSRDTLDDKFKYDGITPYHRYYLVEDCHQHMRIDDFYVDISQDLNAPQKGKGALVIPFEKSGKFVFSSNYPPYDPGPSTERRTIYNVFSDLYHNHGEQDDYLEMRDPKTDLGASLVVGYDEKQMNLHYNTMLSCLSFYLGIDEKIKPAMENVNKRSLLSEMGDNFHSWAIAYFSEEGGNVDKYVIREYAFEEYKNATKDRGMTSNSWLKRLASFCRYYGYTFNPKVYLNAQKKIIKKAEVKHFDNQSKQWVLTAGAEKVTKEMVFIQTRDTLPEDPHIGQPAGNNDKPKDGIEVNF